ncbi:YqjF family protein [Halobium salinum]|uniref:YqjF family protein n=1 Tax=Halobium salinum TaxID=1364940 RepID=A0ABD5PDW0_9EURY|nr:DUF2071 domain-containing protein [Halobium salinum]
MRSLLTVTGRDVCFVHWPVAPDAVRSLVPDALELDTYDGSAWVSALALEVVSVGPGSVAPGPLSADPLAALGRVAGGFPQLVFRTYVRLDDEPGIYFLSVDTGSRAAATVGRRAFGLPFHGARMRRTRREDGTVTFRSCRRKRGLDPSASAATFQARYRPTGEPFEAESGSFEAFAIERFRYFLPPSTEQVLGTGRGRVTSGAGEATRVGTVERVPWTLRSVDAEVRQNTLFEAVGLPAPTTAPTVRYSPGFEMAVGSGSERDR